MAETSTFRKQRTLARTVFIEGTGLHTGSQGKVTLVPAPDGTGIQFYRTDLAAAILMTPKGVTSTARGTTLTGEKNASVHTVEHLLAAITGAGIDNLRIEMDMEEVPILDGSASLYSRLIHGAGYVEQQKSVDPIRITETLEFQFGDITVKAEPAEKLFLDVSISFPYPGLESQRYVFELEEGSFERELAPARTFCFEEEVEALRKQGLIKGGNLQCAIVMGKKGTLNGPLRFDDEIVRHKTLDLLGDLTLLNRPLIGKITVRKAGHRYHVELAKVILEKFGKSVDQNQHKGGAIMLDILGIQKALPHRYPFLLIDRVLELDDKKVVAIKNVTINEPFFQGHFPGHPIMPGVLVIEAMAQAGGVIFLHNSDGKKILYLAGVDKAKFRKPVLPGDQIRFEVEVLVLKSKVGKIAGKAIIDGKVAVQAELTCAIVDFNEMNKE
jgi:UDP-3-O-[3-hydroxymyristoyl] N-acetylglucosamine deacetylase/3-hydroxyacyl-[acyl-carrier-protein] dehydratase